MAIIKVNSELITIAEQIIEAKSSYDEIQAGIDLLKIQTTINDLTNYKYGSADNADKLHMELKQKYHSITVIENICIAFDNLRNKLPSFNKNVKTDKNKQYTEILKIDRFGIWSDVLIKHRVISEAKDFIQSLDESE